MKRIIGLSFALAVIFLASAERSFACSCLVTDEPVETKVKKAFAGSKAIFSGKVLAIAPKDDFRFSVRIRVNQKWKGRISGKKITITTPRDSAMCGYNFVIGKKYLVYAYQADDDLATNSCSRTTFFDKDGDVGYLDKLKETDSPDDADNETVKDRDCEKKTDKKLPPAATGSKPRSGGALLLGHHYQILEYPKRLTKLPGEKNYRSFPGYFETVGPIEKKENFLNENAK